MRLRNRLILILFGSVFVLLLGLYVALFQFGLLEYIVNRKLQNIIGTNLPLKVKIGKIEGDYYSNLTVSDVTAEYDDGKYSYLMAVIPNVFANILSQFMEGQSDIRSN